MEAWGFLSPGQDLIRDRDAQCCAACHQLIDEADVERVVLPPRSPNMNAYAERWVRSVTDEALSRMILVGEGSLRHLLNESVDHDHPERHHQGKGHVRLFPPLGPAGEDEGPIQCRVRLGGLLNYDAREAA